MAVKGFIFTTDAILALAIIVVFFSTITALTFYEPKTYSKNALMDMNTTDNAFNAFYSGSNERENSNAPQVNCAEIFEYESSGNITSKVKRCANG